TPGTAETLDRVGEYGPHERAFALAGPTEIGVQGVTVEVELDEALRTRVRGMMSPMVRRRGRQGPETGIGLGCVLLGSLECHHERSTNAWAVPSNLAAPRRVGSTNQRGLQCARRTTDRVVLDLRVKRKRHPSGPVSDEAFSSVGRSRGTARASRP